jgi:hypothetical protein
LYEREIEIKENSRASRTKERTSKLYIEKNIRF